MGWDVLLVEDNPDDEALTLRALRRQQIDVRVQVARDGEEAAQSLGLDGVHADSSLPNLMILDLKLPKINGLQLLEAIRASAHAAQLPVLALSSSDEAIDIETCHRLGVVDYLRKPVDYDQFISEVGGRVREILQSLNGTSQA
jgi:two-component system, response regulator